MADNNSFRKRERGIWVGMGFIVVGLFVLTDRLLSQAGYQTPPWLFSWPMILIVIGLFNGLRHGFRNLTWAILLLIGGIFLTNEINPSLSLEIYAWPICIIGVGLILILGGHIRGRRTLSGFPVSGSGDPGPGSPPPPGAGSPDREDYFSTTAVFGGVSKKVSTPRFLGGTVTNILGGSEIDLSQCDLSGQVQLTITQIFGGTKLILPPHWTVRSEILILFGGTDDKRDVIVASQDPGKILVLRGATIFGGIEIRSY